MIKKLSLLKEGCLSRQLLIMLVGFTVLRFLLAFLFPVFGDASRYFMMAKAISEDPSLLTRRGSIYPSPLFLMIGACFYRVFSIIGDEFGFVGVRLVSPISGALTVLITYMICMKILNRKAAIYSTILLGLSPSHILFSSVGYMESLFVLFVTIAIYFLIKDNSPTKKSVILSGLSLGLASITRVTGFLLLATFLLYLFTRWNLLVRSKRVSLLVLLICCVLIVSSPYYGRQLYETGAVEMIGQVFPPREGLVFLDTLLYRETIVTETAQVQSQSIHFNPWFRMAGTYFEFWGIWGGAVDVLFRIGAFGFPLLVLIGFAIITLFLTFFHLYGSITLKGKQEYVLLHLCVLSLFSVFLTYVTVLSLQQGFICFSMGYRKPLITVAPVLAIYGGYGLDRIIKKMEGKRYARGIIKFTVAASLLVLLIAVVFEGVYMRERYETSLLGAAGWLKQGTDKGGTVLTIRSLEIAYLAGRRTVALSLIAPNTVDRALFETYSISHVLIPTDFAQERTSNPYMGRFRILENEGVLREVYRDSGAFILEFVASQ